MYQGIGHDVLKKIRKQNVGGCPKCKARYTSLKWVESSIPNYYNWTCISCKSILSKEPRQEIEIRMPINRKYAC